MKEAANRGKGKTLLISAGIEIMLIICIIAANLNPTAILYFIFYNLLYGLVFRGFVQSRIDQQFGWVPPILVSGAMFSLYHLGYPGFRTWEDILLLFAVGAGFAAAYKLSGNNLMVSFFVNLPNAFVTYILKYEQFPVMRASSTIAAAVTLVLIGLILLLYRNAVQRRQ